MTDDDYDALSQKQLASIKRDMRISLEDAAVRATYKVMAELAQPEQEPVGCIPWHWVDKAKQIADGTIAYPDVERAQQAIALIKILLKSTPPQRKPLTDEQIDSVMKSCINDWGLRQFARAIEVAHGIKE